MTRVAGMSRLLVVILACAVAVTADRSARAQPPASPQTAPPPTPEGYMPRGVRPAKGLAPGMKVADLGKGARTFRVNFVKGDEIMSGMTEFAEKYHIRNGHFTGL